MPNLTQRSVKYSGAAATAALTVGAALSLYPPLEWLAATIAALALPALGFAGASFMIGRQAKAPRRPRSEAFALVALAPFAPILPSFATLFVTGLFIIFGLFVGSRMDAIVAAFARERGASVFGGMFVLAIAAFAATSGFGMTQAMPFLIGLCGTVAILALASVAASNAGSGREQ